jgi:hypothetical protein
LDCNEKVFEGLEGSEEQIAESKERGGARLRLVKLRRGEGRGDKNRK